MKTHNLHFKGNEKLLEHPKTAFFCSRNCAATVISKSYDWAIKQKDKGNCIISGFHSQIERDVLHFLLKGDQPIIMVLARSMHKRLPDQELKQGINGRRYHGGICCIQWFHFRAYTPNANLRKIALYN